MIDFNVTNEEKDALKYYRDEGYKAVNQMLISNSESDIALLSDEVEKDVVEIKYDRESVMEYLDNIKVIYRLILKKYYENKKRSNTTVYRGTNLAEIEMLKISPYIDKFLIATLDKDEAENKYSSDWNRPANMNIVLLSGVPYLQISDVLKSKKYAKDVIISPFTKVRSMSENSEITLNKNSKTSKVYSIELEKQELDSLSKEERDGLYKYIIDNSVFIKRKLEECINLEKENSLNYENIRKLEQLLNKYENSDEDEETENDELIVEQEDDINRINKELEELKKASADLFEIRKENINFINMWKRNIAVYMIAECREIEKEFEDFLDDEDEEDEVENVSISEENSQNDLDEKLKTENVVQEVTEETVKEMTDQENIEEKEDVKVVGYELAYATAISSCDENIDSVENMLSNINDLITKQQTHAKIAGNIGASYSALNNAFNMRKVTENLLEDVKNIKSKVEALKTEEKTEEVVDKFKNIAKNNIEINTLINYINNPKIVGGNTKATRFDEMTIIEENELKRVIAEKVRDIRGEAELRKLKDDLEIINDKGLIDKIIGFFTGRNKLDEFMIDQIEIRQNAIRKTLAKRMSLAHNYSIHELMAEISMFINDNEDDDLVEKDVINLKSVSNELRKNFVVSDFKVKTIIDEKEHRNLPVEKKRMSKKDIIEVETYRFLNKYGYDISNEDKEEPKYIDTMSGEIERVIQYIDSSKIF